MKSLTWKSCKEAELSNYKCGYDDASSHSNKFRIDLALAVLPPTRIVTAVHETIM
jgi:hypothetical protein